MKNKNRSFLYSIFYICALFPLLIDSYKNPHTFQKYFLFSSSLILFIFVLICIVLRFKKELYFSYLLTFINSKLIFPFFSIISIIFTFLDYFTYPNYVYSKFLINYEKLFYIAIGSLIFIFISKTNFWWSKNWQKFLFFLPIIMFFVFFIIRFWPFDFFYNMVLEDKFIEWSQFFVIFFAGFVSFSIFKLLWSKSKFFGVVYFILFIFSFFMAGEEISWGQRFFNLQVPSSMTINNSQGELNTHNLYGVVSYTRIGYILLTSFGTFSWVFIFFISNKKRFYSNLLFPPWFSSSFFALSFVYQILSLSNNFKEWAEPAELMLYLGIFFFFISLKINLSNHIKLISNKNECD